MGKYYFKPFDISGATLSTECLELFMVKKAVYVVVWDADSSNHAGNIVHWLDAIGTHVPCACVVFVGVKRSTTQVPPYSYYYSYYSCYIINASAKPTITACCCCCSVRHSTMQVLLCLFRTYL